MLLVQLDNSLTLKLLNTRVNQDSESLKLRPRWPEATIPKLPDITHFVRSQLVELFKLLSHLKVNVPFVGEVRGVLLH